MKIKKYIQVAIVMVAGSIIFTMTGCNKTDVPAEEPVAIEQVQEIVEEDNDVAEVDLIESADDIGNDTEAEQAETYKVEFKYARNDEITAKVDEKVTVPEYQDLLLLNEYTSETFKITDETEFNENFEIVSEEENAAGTTTIVAKTTNIDVTGGMVTRYSYDGENMKAVFCYQPYVEGTDQEITVDDFGLNFVIEKDVEDTYKIVGLQDLAGNDANDIILYTGEVVGWSLTENAEMVDFEFGDEIYLSQDLVLYPVVENRVNPSVEEIDHSSGLWIKSIGGTVVRYDTTKRGKDSENGWYSKGGKVVSEDGKKEYNPETKTVEDTTPSKTPDTGKKPDNGDGGNTTPTTPGGGTGKTGGTGGDTTPTTPTTPENNPDPWGVPDVGGNMGTGDYTGMPVW